MDHPREEVGLQGTPHPEARGTRPPCGGVREAGGVDRPGGPSAYRCKDREYVRVARAIDGPDLRMRLEAAADADDSWARFHAGYVLWLLDRPDLPNTRRIWEFWCASSGRDAAETAR
ncbi:hypothetical protein GCM10010403_51720 [Glycomyces rutgersensis]